MATTNREYPTYDFMSRVPHTDWNTIATDLDKVPFTGRTAKSVAGSSDVTLSEAEYDVGEVEATGALTGSISLIFPLWSGRVWRVYNNTSGSFTLTVKGATGTGVLIKQGCWCLVESDGVNFYRTSPDYNATGMVVGASGSPLKQIVAGTIAINPASIAANTTGDSTFTLTGAAAGDIIIMNVPASLEPGLVFGGAFVSAADTVTVRLGNTTTGAIDGASRTWSYLWLDIT